MFSQETVNSYFDKRSRHSGRLIGETLDDICEGRCSVHDLPTIRVMKRDGKWVTADNRRLWVFRQLERLGKCDEVPVRETFYINPDKLNSCNGGISVRVRRYAGGRWHNKPTVSNTVKKQDSILPDSQNLNKKPYDSQRHVTERSTIYGTESLKINTNSKMYRQIGENRSNNDSTVASGVTAKPTIGASDHELQRHVPYQGSSITNNTRSVCGKSGHTNNQYVPNFTRGSAIGPLSSQVPRPAYVRDGPYANAIKSQQPVPVRNSDVIHKKVLAGPGSTGQSISERDRKRQRQVTETPYTSEIRSVHTIPTSIRTPSTFPWNFSDNTRNEQRSNIQHGSSSYSRQTANRRPESDRVNLYDDEDQLTDRQCCVIL